MPIKSEKVDQEKVNRAFRAKLSYDELNLEERKMYDRMLDEHVEGLDGSQNLEFFDNIRKNGGVISGIDINGELQIEKFKKE